MNTKMRNGIAAGLVGLVAAGGLYAQSEDEGPIYTLSPFEVSTDSDVGYLSTNSTSGTSLNTAIKDLPMAVQVINQDFITDLGATDLEEALEYAAGVFTSDQGASTSVGATRSTGSDDKSISSAGNGDRFANVVYIRGLSVPFQNRMGFRYGGIVVTQDSAIALGGLLDSSNIERMEVVKGPNSLLYGVGVLTGIVNVIPEKPLSEPRYEFGVRAGSDGFFRATAELTGPVFREGLALPGELNYRVVATTEEKGHWTDFREEETDYYAIQLEHRYKDKMKLFLEYQDGVNSFSGMDSQWIYDEVNRAFDTEFRNAFDEAYNWARHSGTIAELQPLDASSFDPSVPTTVGTQAGFLRTGQGFQGGGKPATHRITGPDTYARRDEWNFIADLELFPMEGLTINAGVFFSGQDTDELDLDVGSFATSNPNIFVRDTTTWDNQLNAIWNSGGVYGVPMQQSLEQSIGIDFGPADGENPLWIFPALNDDIKLTEYYWERSLVKSNSTQYRLRATYTLDSDWLFGTRATHTFLAGFNYIKDIIDFPDGSINRSNAIANPNLTALGLNDEEKLALMTDLRSSDAMYYRSIDNFEPIYFDGRNDGVNGHSTVRAGDVYLNQEIVQEGYYGVYNGKFFNDRVEVILGARRDIYNADQFTHKRVNISDGELLTLANDWVASQVATEVAARFGVSKNDVLAGNVPSDVLTFNNDLIDQRKADGQYVATYYEESVESGDAGAAYFGANRGGPVDESFGIVPLSQRSVFEEDEEVDTFTFGINFDITDDLTIYGVMSEGISPNTALRDGNGDIIPAEETSNKEIGLKFDFFEGRISGSLAVFEIERENAIWDVDWAPAAAKWFDAQIEANRSREWAIPTFDPAIPQNHYIQGSYVTDYLADMAGVSDPSLIKFAGKGNTIVQTMDRNDIPDEIAPTLRDKLILINKIKTQTEFPSEMIDGIYQGQQFGGNVAVNYVGMNTEAFDDLFEVTLYNPETGEFVTTNVSPMAMVYAGFMDRQIDKTKNNFLRNIHPVRYRNFDAFQAQANNTPDLPRAQGALVTFDETINGVELDVVFTVNDNFQFVVSYSHIEREADDTFNFNEWQSISTGDSPFTAPFTMLHREYGWEQAGMQLVWVDYDAFASQAGGSSVVSRSSIESAIVEEVQNPDETIPMSEMASRNAAGQVLLFVDRDGNVINENNTSVTSHYDNILDGVSLNYNPEDEVSVWMKYMFTEGKLDNLSVNFGVKYVGESATSVAFNSVSPLNELTVTPVVSDFFRFDAGLSYRWSSGRYDWKVSANVYNLFDHTYDVTTTTLGIPNPVTGESVTKRTEKYYSPRSYRVGLNMSF